MKQKMCGAAYIALGSNLPFEGIESPLLLARAVAALKEAGLGVQARSSIWRTAAWPPESGQPDYYNAVVAVDAGDLSPQALYEMLRGVEARFGRERRERWAARTLDLDIIAMGGLSGTFGGVTLPHPRLHERAFVLAPLAEIAPEWRHPDLGKSAAELLRVQPPGIGYRRLSDFPEPAG